MFFTGFLKQKYFRLFSLCALLFAMLMGSNANAETTTIIAKHSGKCLDVRGGNGATGNGAPIEQWACAGPAATNQAWTLKDMGNAQYELIASNSGKCVDIVNGGTANGTAIQQLDCSGQPKQLWRLNSQGSGRYQIISVSSGRCLDVTGGNVATGDGVLTELWDCVVGADNQSWALSVPSSATTQIISAYSNKCLDVTGGNGATGNGVPIEQWTCVGQAATNQSWTVKDMGGYKYEIIASNSGKCLDIANSNPASGTPVQQRDCTGQPNQLWKLLGTAARHFQVISLLPALNNSQNCLTIKSDINGTPTNDGALIVSATCDYEGSANNSWAMDVALPIKYLGGNNNECLDVRGGNQATANGTLIELWTCLGSKNQLWTVKDMGNRKYQFVASNSGKCLDLVGGGTGNGNNIQQSQCANTPSQLWTTENIGIGKTMIKSVASNGASCLDVIGGWSAAADGVLTDLTQCTSFELWNIGTPANFP